MEKKNVIKSRRECFEPAEITCFVFHFVNVFFSYKNIKLKSKKFSKRVNDFSLLKCSWCQIKYESMMIMLSFQLFHAFIPLEIKIAVNTKWENYQYQNQLNRFSWSLWAQVHGNICWPVFTENVCQVYE